MLKDFEITSLPIGELFPSPTNPRKHFDEEKHLKLTENVRKNGVMQQLITRRWPGASTDKFEIVAGERRWRAATAAELERVPVTIRELSDQEVIEIQMIENLQRQDMHPMEEAGGYQALKDISDMDNAGVAAALNVPESTVYRRLQLLKLEPKVKDAFMAGTIHVGHAEAIARLQPKDQLEAFKECFEDEWDRDNGGRFQIRVSTRKLEHWINTNIFLDLNEAAFSKDATLAGAGPCTTCPKRTGFAPALFPDIAKKDTCTDGACFGKKKAAYLKQVEKELTAAAGEKIVKVTEEYGYGAELEKMKKAGITSKRDYTDVAANKPKCDDTVSALVMDGPKTGKTKFICTNTKCKVHSNNSYTAPKLTPKQKAEKALAAFEAKVKDQTFRAAIANLYNQVELPIERDILFVLLGDEINPVLAEVLQFDKGTKIDDFKDATEEQLYRLIVAKAFWRGSWSPPVKTLLGKIVGMKAIEKDVRKRLKLDEKPKAAGKVAQAAGKKKPAKGKMAAANDGLEDDDGDQD